MGMCVYVCVCGVCVHVSCLGLVWVRGGVYVFVCVVCVGLVSVCVCVWGGVYICMYSYV